MTISIPIIINETQGLNRDNEPVNVSAPFPMGAIFQQEQLSLLTETQLNIDFQLNTTATWPDGSIRWGNIFFQACINANDKKQYTLTNESFPEKQAHHNKISHSKNALELENGSFQLSLSKNDGIAEIKHQSEIIKADVSLIDNTGQPRTISVDKCSLRKQSAYLQSTIDLSGHLSFNNNHLNVQLSITSYLKKPWIRWELTVHNPRAAQHANSMWDLGDPNSARFKSLAFSMSSSSNSTSSNSTHWKLTPACDWQQASNNNATIHQESSGGPNWDSSNHTNSEGDLSPRYCGGMISSGQQEESVQRATPVIVQRSKNSCRGIFMPQFWQNFPKTMSATNGEISLSLFPESHTPHELQGGESKTHSFYTFFADDELSSITHPLHCHISPTWLSQTNALLFFNHLPPADDIDNSIQKGITGSKNFLEKREEADEYGWRNFGDLHADHESLYKEGKDFVSHYNNQYDPLYGFIRQYLLSGNEQWRELACDLASHVKDIDIYNTSLDKPEYNGGLFWHTDHYLDAYTSSHRTYSQKQLPDTIYESHGGGPGGQHCYTTGLLYHYFLTGEPSSKKAIFTLTEWITHFYEGDKTLLSTLLSFKNRHIEGHKNAFTSYHAYPLDRGTGNYIVALLDCFAVCNDPRYIHRAENIILNTVHPRDDLALRNFENIEKTWFYTIFFQAVCRYLETKETLGEIDDTYIYAKDSLLHYANWAKDHESPYLSKPEILEYPNHTWAAQDIRKANLLYAAYHYSGHDETFLKAANNLYSYVESTLINEPTSVFTRILAILMQNHGCKYYYTHKSTSPQPYLPLQKYDMPPNSKDDKPIMILFEKVFCSLSQLSISNEIQWLKRRLRNV